MPGLDRSMVKKTVQQGYESRASTPTAPFYDNGKNAAAELKAKWPFLGQSTGLAEYIVEPGSQAAGASEMHMSTSIGLALDYCVAFSAKDAAGEKPGWQALRGAGDSRRHPWPSATRTRPSRIWRPPVFQGGQFSTVVLPAVVAAK